MDHKKIFHWLTLDMAVFFAANAVLISRYGNALTGLLAVTPLHFVVLALAAYRASNIISNETVTKPLRAPFVDEIEKDGRVIEEPKKSGFLGATGLLIYCPSCTGVWLAAALVYGYALRPTPTFVVALFLALSAVERLMAAGIGRLKANL